MLRLFRLANNWRVSAYNSKRCEECACKDSHTWTLSDIIEHYRTLWITLMFDQWFGSIFTIYIHIYTYIFFMSDNMYIFTEYHYHLTKYQIFCSFEITVFRQKISNHDEIWICPLNSVWSTCRFVKYDDQTLWFFDACVFLFYNCRRLTRNPRGKV